MSDNLSKEASALVREGRQALRPTQADKARILAAIKTRAVAGNAVAEDVPPPPPPKPHAGGFAAGKIAALTVGVLAALAAFVASNGETDGARQADDVAAASVAPSPAAVPSVPSSISQSDVQPTSQAPSLATETPPPRLTARAEESDRLAEEVALLTRAEKEFHSGNLKRALSATDEHRVKFPKGTLAQERNSLRIQVLCGLGYADQAQSEAKRTGRLATAPATAAQVCGGGH